MRRRVLLGALAAAGLLAAGCSGGGGSGAGGSGEVRIPLGAGGVGFLPLYMMREHGLIEKHARAAGLEGVEVRWIDIGGPAVMNDALLSGSVDFIAAGPPAFLTLWDRTRGSTDVRGVAAMTSLPMYLNTRAEHLDTLDDVTETDKIALTAVKVSIPALIMQMYARERYGDAQLDRFDKYTVTMTHPDGVVALLTGSGGISAHFTSPPFHQREISDPSVRTIMSSDDVMGGSTTFTMLSTTSGYRERNPDVFAAVLAALEEANGMIRDDPAAAAEVLRAADAGAGFETEELTGMLDDPAIRFTTTPENVMKYAEFMHDIGSIRNRPESWRDLFFPEIHESPGS
ncbi:MAG: ABC transporter substrate-binding protein [Gammaproteobacteria bacterium]|nr:ABC transporter substrate-binding protein [Gammaproteobacteria bacterium]